MAAQVVSSPASVGPTTVGGSGPHPSSITAAAAAASRQPTPSSSTSSLRLGASSARSSPVGQRDRIGGARPHARATTEQPTANPAAVSGESAPATDGVAASGPRGPTQPQKTAASTLEAADRAESKFAATASPQDALAAPTLAHIDLDVGPPRPLRQDAHHEGTQTCPDDDRDDDHQGRASQTDKAVQVAQSASGASGSGEVEARSAVPAVGPELLEREGVAAPLPQPYHWAQPEQHWPQHDSFGRRSTLGPEPVAAWQHSGVGSPSDSTTTNATRDRGAPTHHRDHDGSAAMLLLQRSRSVGGGGGGGGGATSPRSRAPHFAASGGGHVGGDDGRGTVVDAPATNTAKARRREKRSVGAGGGVDLKVVILGAQGVGKTSLVHRYTTGQFSASSIPSTIGASFLTQKLLIDGTKVRLQLWDTAGQERFRSMAPMYYRGAHAAVIVYDVTNAASFSDVKSWIEELRRNVTTDLVIHVVGSKLDLAPTKREVRLDDARQAVEQWTDPGHRQDQMDGHRSTTTTKARARTASGPTRATSTSASTPSTNPHSPSRTPSRIVGGLGSFTLGVSASASRLGFALGGGGGAGGHASSGGVAATAAAAAGHDGSAVLHGGGGGARRGGSAGSDGAVVGGGATFADDVGGAAAASAADRSLGSLTTTRSATAASVGSGVGSSLVASPTQGVGGGGGFSTTGVGASSASAAFGATTTTTTAAAAAASPSLSTLPVGSLPPLLPPPLQPQPQPPPSPPSAYRASWDEVEVTEVSAKDGVGIEDVFVGVATRLVERRLLEIEEEQRRRERESVLLHQERHAGCDDEGRRGGGGGAGGAAASGYVLGQGGAWSGSCCA